MRHALPGIAASRGSVLGRARVRLPHVLEVVEQYLEPGEVEPEVARLHAAITTVRVVARATPSGQYHCFHRDASSTCQVNCGRTTPGMRPPQPSDSRVENIEEDGHKH